MLIVKQDVHEGLWSVSLQFGLGAGLIPAPPSGAVIEGGMLPDNCPMVPGAILPVLSIGLIRCDTKTPITVDAAEVNPLKTTTATTPPEAFAKTGS